MNFFKLEELKELAVKHEAGFFVDETRSYPEGIFTFNDCIFKSTVYDYKKDRFGGFVFHGEIKTQDKYINLINDLNKEHPKTKQDTLTLDRAKGLIGKVVECEYNEYARCKFRVVKLEKQTANQIGQNENYVLVVNNCNLLESPNERTGEGEYKWSEPQDTEMSFPYEWQGVFRVTGSAHVLRILNIN